MEKYQLLSTLISRSRLNNKVSSEIINALEFNSETGITSAMFVLLDREEMFVLNRNTKRAFSFSAQKYQDSRQDVLNILGYHGYEVIEGKDRTNPNNPLVTIIVKPIRSLVSGREEVRNV